MKPRLLRLEILNPSTKFHERDQNSRKSLFYFTEFISLIFKWQELRPPLLESDMNLELLIFLILSEIEEVDEEKRREGSSKYLFVNVVNETMDLGFLAASVQRLSYMKGHQTNHHDIVASANGQAGGSNALEKMREVTGNFSERSLNKDLKYLWTLWVSYIINMKFPVAPNEVLLNYTFPKNNGNYIEKLLASNPLFERAFPDREMTKNEKKAYFSHYRKATRIIRNFISKHVDKDIKDTGLKPEHYEPYEMFIFNFMSFRGTGLNPREALIMLENQLHTDWKVPRRNSSYSNEVLDGNSLFETAYGRKMDCGETLSFYTHAERAMEIIHEYEAKKKPIIRETGVGLNPELYLNHVEFIHNFKNMPGIGLSPDEALHMLNGNLNSGNNHSLKPVDKIQLPSV